MDIHDNIIVYWNYAIKQYTQYDKEFVIQGDD